MRRIWVAGIHKLANTVSLPPRHHKPRTLCSLWCVIAVYGASELQLKVICVVGNSTVFLLVASFVMEKSNRYSYDTGYKLEVIAYAEEHGNRAAEQHFSPPPTEKNICNWWASKEELKKMMIFRDFKRSLRFYKLRIFFFLVWLCNLIIKMVKFF